MEIDGVIDVTTAEAQALRDCLCLVERVGCNLHIYIKSDCLEAIQVLADPTQYRIAGEVFWMSVGRS